MTLRIRKSQVHPDFEQAVEAHRQALLTHRFAQPDRKTKQSIPRPTASGIVEASVTRVPGEKGKPDDFIADYEIVDDTPPPPSLVELKNKLIHEVSKAEQELLASIIPFGKRRLLDIKFHEIMSGGGPKTIPDTQLVNDYNEKLKRMQGITKRAAQMQSDIEDLTEATIGAWKMEAFE